MICNGTTPEENLHARSKQGPFALPRYRTNRPAADEEIMSENNEIQFVVAVRFLKKRAGFFGLYPC